MSTSSSQAVGALYAVEEDPEAEHAYGEVDGLLTNPDGPVFDADLLAGEKIAREFRIFTVAEPVKKWQLVLFGLMTFGIYPLYVLYCKCGLLPISNKRNIIAVTNKGRLAMWSVDMEGGQGSNETIRKASYGVTTKYGWFHISDVNSFRIHQTKRNRYGPFSQCGRRNVSRIRLFMGGTYPKQSLLEDRETNDSGSVVGLRMPEWDRGGVFSAPMETAEVAKRFQGIYKVMMILVEFVFEFLTRDCFQVFTDCCKLAAKQTHIASCGLLYKAVPDISEHVAPTGELSFDVVSSNDDDWTDGYHPNSDDAISEGFELVNFINEYINGTSEEPLVPMVPRKDNFVVSEEIAPDTDLIVNDKIQLNRKKIPIATEETIYDATPVSPGISWWELVNVPTLCFRDKFKSQAAVIVSSEKVTSIAEYRHADDYELTVTGFFLGDKTGSGAILRDPIGPLGYIIDMSTEYGAIRIQLKLCDTWPWTPTVPQHMRPEFYEFVGRLGRNIPTTRTLPSPDPETLPNGPEVEELRRSISLWSGEKICSMVASRPHHHVKPYIGHPLLNLLSCGSISVLRDLLSGLTCGYRPWWINQFLVLTTHRLIVTHAIQNECATPQCQQERFLVSWVPISDLQGVRLEASFHGSFPGSSRSAIEVSTAIDESYDNPFEIQRFPEEAERGPLEYECEDINHLRSVVSFYQYNCRGNRAEIEESQASRLNGNPKYGKRPLPKRVYQQVTNPVQEIENWGTSHRNTNGQSRKDEQSYYAYSSAQTLERAVCCNETVPATGKPKD
eukprot:gb/GECG01011198.1/.p1 GENE.gb/GECG01011198.1/~~gb/GECG01011198.1/.p1  ORF type:complete len:784 (+),score=57.91 gb/GECG01011198.1/:1-2352(+)